MYKPEYNTDKLYWHSFTDFYNEQLFTKYDPESICEIGVLDGESIRMLHSKYPHSKILGIDITPVQDNWPQHENIAYVRADQDDQRLMSEVFHSFGPFDLVIDDGSHQPKHQATTFFNNMHMVRGYYVVEDLHCCLDQQPNFLNWILLVKHHIDTLLPYEASEFEGLISHYPTELLYTTAKAVRRVRLYRRACLPRMCYKCRNTKYNYKTLVCQCGTNLFDPSDSMTAILDIY